MSEHQTAVEFQTPATFTTFVPAVRNPSHSRRCQEGGDFAGIPGSGIVPKLSKWAPPQHRGHTHAPTSMHTSHSQHQSGAMVVASGPHHAQQLDGGGAVQVAQQGGEPQPHDPNSQQHQHQEGVDFAGIPGAGTVRMVKSSDNNQLQKSNRPCRHNQRGRCTWGEHCRFVHGHGPTPALPLNAAQFVHHVGQQQPLPLVGHQHDMQYTHHYPEGVSHGGGRPTTPLSIPPALSATAEDRTLMIGIQQCKLQNMRQAKLAMALKGSYTTSASQTPGHVTISAPGMEPDTVAFLPESQMAAELRKLDMNPRFQHFQEGAGQQCSASGGGSLMYLIGEPSVFYSAVRMFNTQGTCGHNRLDFALHMAQQYSLVECMFHRSAAGCQRMKCSFEHRNLYVAAQEGTLGLQLPAGFQLLNDAPMPGTPPGAAKPLSASSSMLTPPICMMIPPPTSAATLTPPSLTSATAGGHQPLSSQLYKFTASTASFGSIAGASASNPCVSIKQSQSVSSLPLSGSQDDVVFPSFVPASTPLAVTAPIGCSSGHSDEGSASVTTPWGSTTGFSLFGLIGAEEKSSIW